MKYSFFIIVLLALCSCEKIIDMDIPDKGRRPVINCIFGEGGVPELCLHRSRYILDNSWQFEVINNAVVIITYPGGISDTLKQTVPGSTYRSTSPLAGHGNYSLYVAAEGYSVTATTDLPSPVAVTATDTSSFVIENHPYLRLDAKFSDPPAAGNYYMAGVEREGYSGEWIPIFVATSDLNASGEYQGMILFKDDLFNGTNKTMRLELSKSDLWSQEDSVNLMIKLYSLSYDCYMYMLTVEQAGYDSPFMEPVVVHTNIKEGYGIFAGYNVSVFPLKVPAYKEPMWQE